MRGYPETLVNTVLSGVKFEERKSALLQKDKTHRKILPFVTQYHPAVPNLKKIIMSKWHLIRDQPLLREIYKGVTKSHLLSRTKEENRSKIYSCVPNSKGKEYTFTHNIGVVQACHIFFNFFDI